MLLGLTAASTLLPLSWGPRFQLQPLIQPPVRQVTPLACPCSVLGSSTLVCRQELHSSSKPTLCPSAVASGLESRVAHPSLLLCIFFSQFAEIVRK